MALLLTAIVVFGFSHTVPFDLAPPGLPVLLQLHAAVFVAWVLLFIAQPALIARRAVALHRKIGWAGAGLAGAMVVMGGAAILFALRNDTVPGFYPKPFFLMRGLLGLVVFAGLFSAAIVQRRRKEWHKRLMLCAAITIVVPGLERGLPLPLLGAAWPYVADGIIDAIALVGPTIDLIMRRRIHPAYLWGVGTILGGQVLVYLLTPSPVAAALLRLAGAR